MPSGAAPVVGQVLVDPSVVVVDELMAAPSTKPAKTVIGDEDLRCPVQGDGFTSDQPLVVSSTDQVRAGHQRRAAGAYLAEDAAAQKGAAESVDPNRGLLARFGDQQRGQRSGDLVGGPAEIGGEPVQRRMVQGDAGLRGQLRAYPAGNVA